jgi:hypothetical protein
MVNCNVVTRMWKKKHDLAQCISIFVTQTVNDTVYFLLPYFHMDANALCVYNRDADILAHRNAGWFSCEAVVKIM